MDSIGSASSVSCTMCHDRGFSRNPKYFFYGVCLIACGALMFFQWAPAPRIFTTIWGLVAQFGLPDFVGTGLIFSLTAFPPLYGAWFIIVWRRQGICPQCRMWPRRSAGHMESRAAVGARCTRCGGRGFLREESFFFYGVCLLASGALALFQWTSPDLFLYVWRCAELLSLPSALGTVLVIGLASFPPVLGAASLFAWRRYGMCPECGAWPR